MPEPAHEEALRRCRVVWVRLGDRPPRDVWQVWHDGGVHVVTGPGEQDLPGADDAVTAVVTVPGPTPLAGQAAELRCSVERVEPGTPHWDAVVPLLAARRLNGPDPGELPARWAATAVVLRLVPQP